MKADLTRLCAALFGLVVCAAAQDLAPTLLGAKPPLLLLFGCLAGIPTAIGAGLFTDALGGLPFGCSALFFLAVALFVRLARPAALVGVMLAAGLYQLWIALWGGGAISRWDPETGQMLAKYALPALNVSSCCFGGENMDTLFITTASQDTDTHVYPLAGNVFCMKPGVKGALSYRYKG